MILTRGNLRAKCVVVEGGSAAKSGIGIGDASWSSSWADYDIRVTLSVLYLGIFRLDKTDKSVYRPRRLLIFMVILWETVLAIYHSPGDIALGFAWYPIVKV